MTHRELLWGIKRQGWSIGSINRDWYVTTAAGIFQRDKTANTKGRETKVTVTRIDRLGAVPGLTRAQARNNHQSIKSCAVAQCCPAALALVGLSLPDNSVPASLPGALR